jgi:hypothetical protein
MNYRTIMQTRPEISKLVMEKYPRSKSERRGCMTERAFRDRMRFEYAKKLITHGEQREKVEFK